MQTRPKWNAFEHQIYRLWKQKIPANSCWVVASSGGLDSVVLMNLALQLRGALGFSFRVAHFHHGDSTHKQTRLYRAKARRALEQWCKKNNIEFVTNSVALQIGSSESDFREQRYAFFHSQMRKNEWLVTAHHETDLLETRLLRLIRGVGPQGLEAIKFVDKKTHLLRPLLTISRDEMAIYAKEKKLPVVKDPSNAKDDFLRNWLRRHWLKSLERKSPGSVKALARSLETISGLVETKKPRRVKKIARKTWSRLSEEERKSRLAQFLRQNNVKGYGQTHIEEILKRLDTRRKRHTFELLGRTWFLDPQHLALEREDI